MKNSFLKTLLLVFALLCTHGLWAQVTSGELTGTVKDSSGAVIPNASVKATNEATNITATTAANASGEFRFPNLLPGLYDLNVTATGFQGYSLRAISVQLNKSSSVVATLSVGAVTSVEVTADAGMVLDTTTNNLTTTFSNLEASTLPISTVGLGILNTSLLAPNVASSGGIGIGTGPSVGGQRPRNNNYTIEGIDDNQKNTTGPLLTVPDDAVGNFTLITSQFSPEFGHSSGGQFNTTILSGTNQFHGRIYEYFQNRNLNAIDATQGGKTTNPRFDFNRYGGQLGGPIVHDKLFFFGNFERSTLGEDEQYFLCTPTAAGLSTLSGLVSTYGLSATNVAQYIKYMPAANYLGGVQVTSANDQSCGNEASGPQTLAVFSGTGESAGTPYPGGLDNGPVLGSGSRTDIPLGNYNVSAPIFSNTDRLTTSADYTISSQDSLRFRYLYSTQGTEDTAAYLPVFFQSIPIKLHLGSLSEFHSFTPNLTNEVRIGYNRFSQVYSAGSFTYPGLNAFPNLVFYDQGSLNLGPNPAAPQSTVQNMYQFVDNINYTKGRHTLVFGFDGRKYISPQTFTQLVRGEYQYDYLTEFFHDLAPTYQGQRSTGDFTYYGDQTALYGYGNDTWRVTPKFTLNIGLRYEFTSVPAGERTQSLNIAASDPGLISFTAPQPQYKNFAPRLGAIFAPDSKTSIRAGFGIAYDVLFDNLGLLSFPPQYSSTNNVGLTPGMPSWGDPNFLASGGLPAGTGTLNTYPNVAAQRAATSAYLPNQVIPYSENYNLTIQRTIGLNYTAMIQYLGTRGIHLPTQVQINVQPKVTPANQLFTDLSPTDATSGPTVVSSATNVSTLGQIQANDRILPAYKTQGFTNPITAYEPYSESNYNALGLNLTRRLQNGFQMNASYTWSKTMDDATAETFATVLTPRRPQNSQCVACDYSRSALDRTNRISVEVVYDLPYFKHSNYLLKNVVGNWLISPVYIYESPEYVTVLSGVNSNLNGDSPAVSRTMVNPTGNRQQGDGVNPVFSSTLANLCNPASPSTAMVGSTLACSANLIGYRLSSNNPNAYYVQAGQGTLPDASRNSLAGRPIDNLDLSAVKRFSFGERLHLEFAAQAFNVLNHAEYVPGLTDAVNTTQTNTQPTSYQTVTSPNFNKPGLVYKASARTLQLSGKFLF